MSDCVKVEILCSQNACFVKQLKNTNCISSCFSKAMYNHATPRSALEAAGVASGKGVAGGKGLTIKMFDHCRLPNIISKIESMFFAKQNLKKAGDSFAFQY